MQQAIAGLQQFNHSFDSHTIAAVCHKHPSDETDNHLPSITLVESVATHADAVPDVYGEDKTFGQVTVLLFSGADLGEHQESDPNISQVIQSLKSSIDIPHNIKVDSPDIKLMLKEWKH